MGRWLRRQSTWHSPLLRSATWMLLAALAVRFAAMGWLYRGPRPVILHEQFGAPSEVSRVARSIASGEGFSSPLAIPTGPTAWVAPVYAYLLAGVFRVFGVYTIASAVAIRILDSLFSALTCLPIVLLARRSFGPAVAAAAGWTWVLLPFAGETCLATLLFSVLILMATQIDDSPGLGRWVGFGLLWGLAALTNPPLLTVLPFLVGWLGYRLGRQGVPWARWAGVAALAFLIVVAPWFVRNYLTFGRFIPFKSVFGLELYVDNSPETDQIWREWRHPNESRSELYQMVRLGEVPYMDAKWRAVRQFIASHPGTFAWLTLKRIVYFWTGIWNVSSDYLLADPDRLVRIPALTMLTVLAFVGLRMAFRQDRATAWLYGLVLFSAPLTYYITNITMRYRRPLQPLLVILAAYAGVEFERKRAAKSLSLDRASGKEVGRSRTSTE